MVDKKEIEEMLRKEFDAFDYNKDGLVTKEEVKIFIDKLDIKSIPKYSKLLSMDFDTFYDSIDKNHDTKISFDEFSDAFHKYLDN